MTTEPSVGGKSTEAFWEARRRYLEEAQVQQPKCRTQRVLCRIWARVYERWLWPGERVVHVSSWRSARVVGPGTCRHIRPCFWWFD